MCQSGECQSQRARAADEMIRTLSVGMNSGNSALAEMRKRTPWITAEEVVALRYNLDASFAPVLAANLDEIIELLGNQLSK